MSYHKRLVCVPHTTVDNLLDFWNYNLMQDMKSGRKYIYTIGYKTKYNICKKKKVKGKVVNINYNDFGLIFSVETKSILGRTKIIDIDGRNLISSEKAYGVEFPSIPYGSIPMPKPQKSPEIKNEVPRPDKAKESSDSVLFQETEPKPFIPSNRILPRKLSKDVNISIDVNYKISINDKEVPNVPKLKNVPDLSKVSDIEEAKRLFKIFLDSNWDYIQSITPQDYVITKDDEWNDPIYDNYAIIDKK